MKVEVIEENSKEFGYEYQNSLEIKIDGGSVFNMHNLCECPEDASFERDLSDCNYIPELLRRAWEAGKACEEFSIEYIQEDE